MPVVMFSNFPTNIESNRKANKIWVNKGSEFYNRLMKSWLQDTDIEIYLTLNEENLLLLRELLEP